MTNTSVFRNKILLVCFLNPAGYFLKLSCRLYRVYEVHTAFTKHYHPMMGDA